MEGSSRASAGCGINSKGGGKSLVQWLKECSQPHAKSDDGKYKFRSHIFRIGTRLSHCVVDIMLLMSQGSDEMVDKFQEFSRLLSAQKSVINWESCAVNKRVTGLLRIAFHELVKINKRRMRAIGGRLATMEGYNYGTELYECFCIITLTEILRVVSPVISKTEAALSVPVSNEVLTWLMKALPEILDEMETKIRLCIKTYIEFVVDAEPVVNDFQNIMKPKINQMWNNFGSSQEE
ncbi:unnamed protein product [Malus baccata var. baccata]